MARYIDMQPIIDDLDRDIEILNKYRLQAKEDNRPDDRMMYARKLETLRGVNNFLKEQPTADVVEREKIDKVIDEIKEQSYLSYDDNPRRVLDEECVLEILKRNIGESKNEKRIH